MILFTSDYTEGAHPRIIEKLAETNMEQTVGYGEDPYCEAAREAIKKVCDAPDADVHFLVGGTQTGCFPFDNDIYLTLSDSQASILWHSEFDKLR